MHALELIGLWTLIVLVGCFPPVRHPSRANHPEAALLAVKMIAAGAVFILVNYWIGRFWP